MMQRAKLPWLAGALTSAAAGLLTLLLLIPEAPLGNGLLQGSYDVLHRASGTAPLPGSEVVVVYIDLESYLATRQEPSQPWSRALHAQLVRRLCAAGARAIVFDVVFTGASSNPASDQEFARALKESGRTIIPAELNSSGQQSGGAAVKTLVLRLPDEPFLSSAAGWGLPSLRVDDDFVVRQYFSGFKEMPTLTMAAARLLKLLGTNCPSAWVRYYGPPLTIPHVGYSAALGSDIPDSFFRNKIVFVGARPFVEGFRERRDELRSPFRTWADNRVFMPAVEVHATEMLNLIRGDLLTRLPRPIESSILLGSALLLGFGLMLLRPLTATGWSLVFAGAAYGVAQLSFARGVWFPWLIIVAAQIPLALLSSIAFHSVEWYRTRRRMEAAKRAADAKIREQASLIDKAHDAILVQGLDGRILYANPSAEKLYGWSLDEMQHDGFARRAFGADPPKLDEAQRLVRQAGDWSGELRQQTRGDTPILVDASWTLIRDEGGTPTALLMIHSDITDRKQLEAQLLRTQRMDTIGSIAGGMAHDLNNALSPVLLGAQLLKRKADEETARILSLMETSTQRGAEMVRQVLLFARGKEGDFERVNVGALLKDIARMARDTFPKSIVIESFVAADIHPVRGNVTQLHQILLNLCVNARDAMPQGGRISLVADNVELPGTAGANAADAPPGDYVSISVADTGMGMSAEVQARIFEPFFTTKPEGHGTGLGLATVQRLVKSHRGILRLESEPGQGSTFEVLLPRAAETVKEPAKAAAQPQCGRGELILVIDDDQAIRDLLVEGLVAYGFRVLAASGGMEGLRLFHEHASEIKLVITDSAMPLVNGMRVISQIRQSNPVLPIIIASADVEAVISEPGIARITKPFAMEALLSAIAPLLARSV